MASKNLLTILAVFGIASILVLLFNPGESGIPPTPAWETIETGTVSIVPITGENQTSALLYNDKLYILSDGSINLTISSFP